MAKVQQQGQKPAKSAEPVAVADPVKSPYRYFVPGEKPRLDQAYFELLLAKLLRAPGEFASFDDVWPGAVQALAGMNLLRLSTYNTVEVRDAIVTVGGDFNTRMNAHAESIIRWAQSFWRIRQIYGTFRRYLRSFEVDGFEALLEDLKVRLPGLSPEFIVAFLRDAGEKVPAPEKPQGGRQQQQQRGSGQQEARGNDPRHQPQPQQPQRQQQSPQPLQQQKPQESGRGDRRRRQRGRSGALPAQVDQQQTKQLQVQQQPPQVKAPTDNAATGEAGTDPQQQRRRNRRRFFRRRRSGGDSGSAPATAS